MFKNIIVLLILSGFVIYADADCICPIESTSLDTLNDGLYEITICYNEFSDEYGDSCIQYTISENILIDELMDNFADNNFVVIAHVDSVYPLNTTQEDFTSESLLVVIDTVIKGNFSYNEITLEHSGTCMLTANSILNEKFLAFFNEYNSIFDLGIIPAPYCEIERGYFIDDNKIFKKGRVRYQDSRFCNMISIEINEFYNTGVNKINQNNKKKVIDIFINEVAIKISDLYKNSEVKIYDIKGKVVQSFENISEEIILWDTTKLSGGVYVVSIYLNKKLHISKLFFLK